jgi:alpha-L-rhamnosidase
MAAPVTTEVHVVGLQAEHRPDALGIGTPLPRLSWRVQTDIPGWTQAAAEIEVVDADSGGRITTGRVEGTESHLVAWPATALRSRQRVTSRVRVWGEDGTASAWSVPLAIEAALLDPTDWEAAWIGAPWPSDGTHPAPLFRTQFAGVSVDRARLHITACGVYEATLNGRPCSDHVLSPGWTSYRHRLRYATLDVTTLVRNGVNELDVVVADGWFCGRLGWEGRRNRYGDQVALLAQLELTDDEGHTTMVVTDDGWKVAASAVIAADLYDGETHDARWAPDHWRQCVRLEPRVGRLEPALGPPVRRTDELAPVEVITTPSGRTVLDFGQNLVGRVRFTVDAARGTEVVIRHAELLEAGEICTRTLRTARATDRYIAAGGGPETWEPSFTFHGFRFVQVEGWPGPLDPDAFRAVVCHSDMERTGTFACSDPRVSRLHDNVVWSMRGNFLDVPTDCPQRDERLGWTGDLQVFAPTASFLYDTAGFLSSWLADLAADQHDDGLVPVVVPALLDQNPAAAGWGDAAVIVPWVVYQQHGDRDLLARQLPSMRAWVDLVARLAGPNRIWARGHQFGDWLDPSAPNDDPAGGRTDPHLVATAYFAHSARIVGLAAEVLDDHATAARYHELAAEVRAAFRREFVTTTGRVVSDSQTAYALALAFRLLEDDQIERAAGAHLRRLVRRAGHRIATGFLGTPLVLGALTETGHDDLAYGMLLQTRPPSWLYAVGLGATTIWERWDALRPDGTVNGDAMTSFNHYALGAVADWMHRTVAGILPLAPGYRRIRIAPQPGGRLTWAQASLRTPYGAVASSWRLEGSVLTLELVVPPSTAAEVVLPAGLGRHEVGAGSHRWSMEVPDADLARWRPVLSTSSTIADLRADSSAWSVLAERLRDLERIPAGSDLEQLSPRELTARYGVTDTTVLDTLDTDLAAI